jgi:DNA modification methylase
MNEMDCVCSHCGHEFRATPKPKHKLLCGDSTSAEDVARLMGGATPVALFTDPPYGIAYDPSWLDGVGTHRRALSSRDTVTNDDGSLDLSFLREYPRRMVWGFPYIYDPGATGWIVWDKQPGVESRGIVAPIEMASTTMRTGFDMVRVMWGGYYRAEGEDSQPHPTQKPIGVYRPFIEAWTQAGDLIFDPFSGSAPVMVATEQTGRICYGLEIEPKYVAVALERLAGMGLSLRLSDG